MVTGKAPGIFVGMRRCVGFPWKGQQRQRVMKWPQSPCATGDKEMGNLGVNLSLWRREGWEGGGFKTWFYFSSPYPDVAGNKLICPSSVCFSSGSNWWVISLCLYLTQELFLIFPHPCPAGEGRDGAALVQPGSSHSHTRLSVVVVFNDNEGAGK